MGGKLYYVVARGWEPGIYDNWDECYAQTASFKKPVYRKFNNLRNAMWFIMGKAYGSPIYVLSLDGKRQEFYDMGAFLDEVEKHKEEE